MLDERERSVDRVSPLESALRDFAERENEELSTACMQQYGDVSITLIY
jgi:hypothetical protein